MALLPKVKLKALVSFPASVLDGNGVDVVKQNGTYQFNLAFDDFAPPSSGLTDPNHQNVLVWNNITGKYDLVPAAFFLPAGGAPVPADTVSPVEAGIGLVGTSLKYARQDHVHPAGGPAAATAKPQVESGTGAVGTSLNYAREDHVHPAGGGSGGGTPSTTPPAMNLGGTGSPGSATEYSRGDHIHPSDTSRVVKAGDTMTGLLNTAPSDSNIAGSGGSSALMVYGPLSGSGTASYMTFHIPGVFATNFGLESNGNFYMGGWSHQISGASVQYQLWTERDFKGWVPSGVQTLSEFNATGGGPATAQGIGGIASGVTQQLYIDAAPTVLANATVFSAYTDQTNLVGTAGTTTVSTVANFAAKTGVGTTAGPAPVQQPWTRVNSSFLHDYSSSFSQHVALFAEARKFAGFGDGNPLHLTTTFAANFSVADNSLGSGNNGNIVGVEINVDGNQQTNNGDSLGLGVYARGNDAISGSFTFTGNKGIVVTSYSQLNHGGTGFARWNTGLSIEGRIASEAISTWPVTQDSSNSPVGLHLGLFHDGPYAGQGQRIAWDGSTFGSPRAWIIFNQNSGRFEFYIDGNVVGHIP